MREIVQYWAASAPLILTTVLVWIVPLIALGWALVTLQRIRTAQEAMRETLVAIERRLRGA
jgi:cytochrome c-type biogenesis protein CcmH/NrfF